MMCEQPKTRYPIIKTLLLCVVLSMMTYTFDYLPEFWFDKSVYRILLSGILIFWLIKLKLKDVLDFSWRNFTKGLMCGGFLFLFSLYILIMNLLSVEAHLSIELANSICNALMIGIFEELAWRGALFNTLLHRDRNLAQNLLPAVFISSVVFGLGHYTNLIYGSSFMDITLQVYSAFCIGILLAAIYIRCKNIWACAFLHALWNFSNWVGLFIFAPPLQMASVEAVSTSVGIAEILGGMIEPTVFLLIGLFLLRRMIFRKKQVPSLS